RALDRRGEGAVGQVVELVRDVVARVLEVPKGRVAALTLAQRLAEGGEGLVDDRALLLEKVIEAMLARNQAQLQAGSTPDVRVRHDGGRHRARADQARSRSRESTRPLTRVA